MPKVKTYKVGEQVFDIPESETSSFLKDNPNAIQLQSFVNGKDTFDIPLPEVDLFLKDNPKATPLYKEDTQKKKEEAESSSELSGGQLSLSEEGKNKPIGEGGIDVSNDIYLYSPTPNENKIKALVPELQDKIMQAKEYAKQDPSLKLDIAQSIIDADTFGGNIVGKASKDGTYYVDINNKPLKNFKEGNILIVPKKGDQDSGFIQLLKNEDGDLNWVKVQAPDPSFSVAKQNPTEDVVVTGYKELQRPKYIQELEKIGKNIYGEDFFIPRDESVTPEEWQKNVDQLGPLSQEFALYNKDNDKGQVLPKFLNAHPDIRQSLEQVLQETPTQLESTKGRNEALTKAVEKTYRLQEQPVNPFAVEDASQFIDAPAFYKNLQLLTNTHNQLKELQEKENLLKDNPKYHNQYTSIQKDIEKLSNNLQPIVQFFQEPNNKRVIDRLEANDALFATQKQGSDVVASLGQFFPKQKAENIREMNARYEANRDPKTMTKEALLDNIENKQFAPIKAAWGAAKNALMDIGASAVGGGFSVGMGNESDRREFRSAIDELKSNVKSYTYVPNLDIRGPNGELLVGNAINNFVKDLGKMTGELAPAMIGGSNKIASSLIFGFQGYQNAKETAKASGMHSDAEASLYALFNGAMMGAIGYGLGGKFGTAAKEFTPSAEAVAMAIAPATREAGVKAILGEMYQGGLKDILKGATKGSIEMKIAGVAEALHNELWNKYRGDLNKFPTEVGGIMDDIKNFAAFAIQQAGMTALGKKGMSNKEKEAVKDYAVLRASQDNPKEVIEALDKLRNLPNADIDNIDAAKDAVLSLTIKNFPKDTTPEQKVELSKQAQIIAEATKEKESIDKEYHAPYNEVIKDANTKIEEILKNPKKVEKEVQENVKPVVEEINKTIAPDETTHPIGEVGHNDAVFNDKKVKEENKNTNEQGDKVDKPIDTKNVGGTEEKVSKPADETEPVKEEINKDQSGTEEKPPINTSTEKEKIYSERPKTQLSHRGLQVVANEFSLPDVQTRDRKTDIELRKEAEHTINEWIDKKEYSNKVESLVKKAENKDVLTDKERVILEQHLANISGELRNMKSDSPEFDTKLAEIKRLKEAGELARSEAGAALRIPTFRSSPVDLADYFVKEMEVAGVDKLTDTQKQRVEKEYADISETQKKYDEKINQLENENARLKAEKEVKKIAATTKKQKKDFTQERDEIITSIKDKLRKSRGETSAVVVPYLKELIVIAPDVAKLAKSYIEQGVTELADIVKNIHGQLKDEIKDLKEEDIHNIIAGEYNEKKPTRNSLTEKYRNLQLEAKLINELQKLQSGEEIKSEKKKVENNKKIKELKDKIKDFGGNESDLNTYKSRTQKKIKEVEAQLKSGDFATPEKKEPLKLDKEAIALKDKLIKLQSDREVRLLKQEYANRSKWQKFKDAGLEVANTPRAIMSSMDFSGTLRQALIATIAHPKLTFKIKISRERPYIKGEGAFWEMFRFARSQKKFDRWFHDLRESPKYKIMEEIGLYIADPHSPSLSVKEEAFMNNLAEKIPLIGRFIKGSERAYVGYLNKMRVDLFSRGADLLEAKGKTIENSKKDYEGLASWVNNSTGRGKMAESLEKAAPLLNSILFSPRLIASRLNILNPLYYAKLPKEIRIMALKDMAKFIGFGISVLALAKLNGADVDDDPRSSDFGKIKVGNTRWDIWGGFQQYVRVASQLLSGQKKSISTGEIQNLDGEGAFKSKRSDVLTSFLRGKLSPIPSMAWDFLSGKTVTGEKTTIKNELESHFLPLIYSDVKEAMKDQGVKSLFTVGIPAAFGIGVSTFSPKEKNNKYLPEDLNDPALKPFVENEIDLPKVNAKFIEIEDRVDGKPKLNKLSDYGEEKIKTFEEEKKKFLKKILTRQHGYAFVDRYGRYSLTAGDGGKKRVKIESITNNEEKKKALKEVLRQASSQSTEQAKEKLFPNR